MPVLTIIGIVFLGLCCCVAFGIFVSRVFFLSLKPGDRAVARGEKIKKDFNLQMRRYLYEGIWGDDG